MYIAMMDSESKTWMALGGTSEEAQGALLNEWNAQQRELYARGYIEEKALFESVEDLEEEYEIVIINVPRGGCVSW